MKSLINSVLVASLFCTVVSAFPAPATAEDVPIVDGTLWMQSSAIEKRSYIIGAGNFISLEYVVQSRAKQPPTPYQSSVPDFYQYTEGLTLDEIIASADGWYKSHPDEMDTPVLTVLWNTLVEPNLE